MTNRRPAAILLVGVVLLVLGPGDRIGQARAAQGDRGLRELVVPSVSGPPMPPAAFPAPPAVSADAYLLADAQTGQVLAARHPDARRPAASTVKLLTAITVLRRRSLDAPISAGPEVTGFEPAAASVGLAPGETWRVADLLEGLIARSGNDAAHALAVGVGGTLEGFVKLMREDAEALGLDGVRLQTPTGLEDLNRLSARDLMVLTRVALADPRFAQIAARPRVDLPDLGMVESRNELLGEYEGAYGVKTGFTNAAGRCLVAAAARDGRGLLVVVLGSEGPTGHFSDARTLLDHGFAAFTDATDGSHPPTVRLKLPGGWIRLDGTAADVLAPATDDDVTRHAVFPAEIGAIPGGRLEYRLNGDLIADTDLTVTPTATRTDVAGIVTGHPAAWFAERAYAAMRAATLNDLWTDGGHGR